MLDEIQQRVLGVLIEKERTVPDSYPLTENSLLQGCNQKSNRDPEMALDQRQIGEALVRLREDSFVARVEGGGRTTKYRHRAEERLNVGADELAVLCELLVRGPQAPGALKPRIARMGCLKTPDQIEAILEGLARRAPLPLVERLPKRPRERDHRFGHLLGPRSQSDEVEASIEHEPTSSPTPVAANRGSSDENPTGDLAELRAEVRSLREEVRELRSRLDALGGGGGAH